MAILIEHNGKKPVIHESAYVAPNATICGDVIIGEHSRVLFGAVLTAESGSINIGANCIIMENAVIRGLKKYPVKIGNNVLIGPHAHLSGCTVENEVFIATGASIFNGAYLGENSTVRIYGIVHIRTKLPAHTKMPIGWVAVGDPVKILPMNEGEKILELLAERDFSQTAFGIEKSASNMKTITEKYSNGLGSYNEAKII